VTAVIRLIGGLVGALLTLAGALVVVIALLAVALFLLVQVRRQLGWRPVGFVHPPPLDRIHRSAQP